jgi:hypothetical protein
MPGKRCGCRTRNGWVDSQTGLVAADAPELPINLTATTNQVGFADLGHLLPACDVEAVVTLDPQGDFLANTVEVQAVEDLFPNEPGVTPGTALVGPVVTILADARRIAAVSTR